MLPLRAIRTFAALSACLAVLATGQAAAVAQATVPAQWPTYGGDPGGQRYTPSRQITAANVFTLATAWTFHTGSVAKNRPGTATSAFEATPILFHGALYFTSPFDEVFAVDPATGAKRWVYDPALPDVTHNGILTSRGVAAWPLVESETLSPAASPCAMRIFVATLDARLIALDAATGSLCRGFGADGIIDLKPNVGYRKGDPYFITSPPTVIGDVVVVGSGVGDNQRVDIESGLVRAFDVRTGRKVWQWEPLPWAQRTSDHPHKLRTGAGNAWSVIAADPANDLVFIPTGAPSPDFYGGLRPGDNRDANSVVALEASTGRRIWGFQVVHHDLWDYDVAAEPLLFTFRGSVPAIAVTTKQGMAFLLNRLTGEPLFPITERPVPASDIPGETASPTQPFQAVDTLAPSTLPAGAVFGVTAADNVECHKLIDPLRYDGIYTPPSLGGSLQYPGNLGGVNWGSASLDPATGILYANTNRYAFAVRLIPHQAPWKEQLDAFLRSDKRMVAGFTALAIVLILCFAILRRRSFWPGAPALALCVAVGVAGLIALRYFIRQEHLAAAASAATPGSAEHFGFELSPQRQTPYAIERQPIRTAAGHPCTVMPFGALSALNLNTGKSVFQAPLGTLVPGQPTGTLSLGGTLVTGSGLVFTAASTQALFRAFDAHTGREIWSTPLPVPAQSTPMSYTWLGRQYIVVADGGHGGFGTPLSDSLIAFALPAK